MEDIGFLQAFYPDRADKYEIRNFDRALAEEFAHEAVRRAGISATNLGEFVANVLDFSEGNPGAILEMVRMAGQAKYRTAEHIKVAPLYIDFRLAVSASAAR
jgi:tryptophanase